MARKIAAILIVAALTLAILSPAADIAAAIIEVSGRQMSGLASWYAEFSPGIRKTTANMEIFDHDKMTCAMWDVPFDTILKVTNVENEKTVYVRVNDRGPARRLVKEGRVIDLTKASFEKIADLRKGLVRVRVELISSPKS
ncbi:MAG: septal ring lytic transglycosylase RlpA family protein [Candidatus Omnitrophota bacterium]